MTTLTEDEVRERLDPIRVIAAIESAFRDRFESILLPTRTHMNLESGIFLAMPCYDRAEHSLGMKLVVVQEKPVRPEDRIQATYMLLDPATGRPQLLAAANYLTDLRTAATSAVATKTLSREDANTLGVFGAGRQARAHIKVMPLVRRFQRLLVCGTNPGETQNFAKRMSAEVGLPVESVDAATCVTESDVICTCTTSQTPLFDGQWLRPGTHLNVVGAFQPHTREVDEIAVQRSRLVVDTYDGVLAEAGDLLIPMRQGLIARDHIVADLHELLSQKKTGRVGPADITLFKSVGCALEDIVTAELLAV
jgi:ornithine cyclodeaminase/alanine dehydrogenase-like protein (mu-crystallin family)